MSDRFASAVLASSSLGSEPGAGQRLTTLATAFERPMPSSEDEAWRYGPINDFELDAYEPVLERSTDAEVPEVAPDSGAAAVVEIVDGWVHSVELDPAWAAKGLTVEAASIDRSRLDDADRFDLLHEALSPQALRIEAAPGLVVDAPIVIRSHHSANGRASFPHVIARTGSDAEISIVEYQTSADGEGKAGEGLSVPLVELDAADASRLRYVTVQELGHQIWQLGRQISTVGGQATLLNGIAAFGGAYARVRTDTRLAGRGASGELVSVYYADGDQIHDFRTFQHHDAPDTLSDLLFKGTIDDQAGSVYTGLIHIHPDGRGSNAHQTNRNVKLSEDAWAWSVPNLEIENNEVRCSHASTVSPIDEDQQFYLHARGVPPGVADRLIVAGFFTEVLDRFPGAAIQAEVRRLVEEKLDRRGARS